MRSSVLRLIPFRVWPSQFVIEDGEAIFTCDDAYRYYQEFRKLRWSH